MQEALSTLEKVFVTRNISHLQQQSSTVEEKPDREKATSSDYEDVSVVAHAARSSFFEFAGSSVTEDVVPSSFSVLGLSITKKHVGKLTGLLGYALVILLGRLFM